MKRYKPFFESKLKAKFKGTCDRVRNTLGGERFWLEMMKNKKEIKESEFLKYVNVKDVLDEDESWEEYKKNARDQGDPIKFYKSNTVYFFQTAGFEFIWEI